MPVLVRRRAHAALIFARVSGECVLPFLAALNFARVSGVLPLLEALIFANGQLDVARWKALMP
jgi:hypothetical protein